MITGKLPQATAYWSLPNNLHSPIISTQDGIARILVKKFTDSEENLDSDKKTGPHLWGGGYTMCREFVAFLDVLAQPGQWGGVRTNDDVNLSHCPIRNECSDDFRPLPFLK